MLKIRNLFMLILIFISAVAFAENSFVQIQDSARKEGEIIGIDVRECGCCGGWIIKTGTDTIKADIIPDEAMYTPLHKEDFPVSVLIEVGSKLRRCTIDYDYYEILFIELVKK